MTRDEWREVQRINKLHGEALKEEKRRTHFLGYNDLAGKVSCKDPAYMRWQGMLHRCTPDYHLRVPSYKGVTCCDEWRRFSAFKDWFDQQQYQIGMQLDKDIRVPGNTVYSPDTCVFLTPRLNTVVAMPIARRGLWPFGVTNSYHRYYAAINDVRLGYKDKRVMLGSFDTPEEAHRAWQKAKIDQIETAYAEWPFETVSPVVEQAVGRVLARIRYDLENNLETTSPL